MPLSLKPPLCGLGVSHSDNLPLGPSNAMWADRGTLCSPPFLPTRQREAGALSRSTSLSSRQHFKLRGLQSPLSHLGASLRARPSHLMQLLPGNSAAAAAVASAAVKTGETVNKELV